ncbi:aldehyde dehydrogenase family protein [Neorhizobium petrolearium]|uniref:aldehyde dehydrogenase (NAD(+)) n=1 Tax=Neorhizobium petrolearium TaxID=515361 RepID=A0ABY8MBP5_9HYPH|nr:aldehyde dehydrogenase family protein [Neorhizobium petrolearium]MCC2613574.1 aldehyde dehydrogenase family protein [Neorhizobium petrolearium]WGI71892.1 aldehyde dehydrogenase family protein [Neorhizobium petrolearium]
MRKLREFYIGGRWVPALSTAGHTLIDSTTEQPFDTVALGGRNDVDAAVMAAKLAFPAWAASEPGERMALIRRIREIYSERVEDMARAISQEMAAPIELARTRQAPAALRHMTNFLAVMEHFEFVRQLGPHAPDDRILMEPIGVVGMITPWNWPMSQVALKVVPALLAGCTMVLKPSELAPLSSVLLAEIIHEAGAPAGVFNLIQGDGLTAGARLVEHPDVAMISFTGSTRAGASIMKGAADTFKRVALELGGKGANLIFADAEEDAVERGVRQCFINSGQNCNAPTRMLVERSIYDEAVEKARTAAQSIAVGPSSAEGAHMGPVISERQFDRVQSLIETGIREGARLVAGGIGRPAGFNRGFFVQPTVFADVSNDMMIAREEIFGPVLSILPFSDEEDAVAIANDTPYGLTNYVQSSDGARRNRLARRLQSGMVEMNGQPRGAGSPFGGVRHSGGAREGGVWGLEEYMVVKSVSGWAS